MAKRRKSRAFGASSEWHDEGAKAAVREVRRLAKLVRTKLKSPADCNSAVRLSLAMAREEGVYLISKTESMRRRAGRYPTPRALYDRVISTCVVQPKTLTAKRKIHAVWR